MLAQAVELFDLRPDWNLEVMRPNQDFGVYHWCRIEGYLIAEQPTSTK